MKLDYSFSSPPKSANWATSRGVKETLIIALVISLTLLVSGIIYQRESVIDPQWARTSGQVSDVKTDTRKRVGSVRGVTVHEVTVTYMVNGRQYQVYSSIYRSAQPAIGESKEVAYNPSRPIEAKVIKDDIEMIAAIAPRLIVIGLAGVIAASVGLVVLRRKRKAGELSV